MFGLDGSESRQINVLVYTDQSTQFRFPKGDKTFTCIDGCLGVASIKSYLNTAQLEDALEGIASLPAKTESAAKVNPLLTAKRIHEWPYKVIYASDGMSMVTLMQSLEAFYGRHKNVPMNRRPNLIHVAGKYCIERIGPAGGATRDGTKLPPNGFHGMDAPRIDVYALATTVEELHRISTTVPQILFNFTLIDNLPL